MTVRYPTQCEIAGLFPINCAARLSNIVNYRFLKTSENLISRYAVQTIIFTSLPDRFIR
ncbi:hypothetical protein R75461_04476 [Paraburkholderia nemoris]|nr:hypothetical protein R75461_04476 [Paraburkholderia nemoris]CAE6836274.1 hypothetical protein R69619_06803 [Paraburkholderia nemoris]CAE6919265.1 hypothetical protein R69608_04003 [Paraburkholderia nemoris]